MLGLAILALLFSSACERRLNRITPAVPGADQEFTFAHAGLERSYLVHVPPAYDESSPMPVVIFLHGGGGSNEAMSAEGLDEYADTFGFIVVAPNGTGRLSDSLLTWNAGAWAGGDCCGYAVENEIDDVGFISALIDELAGRFSIDETRVYATGISNGGMMSYRLACELSNRIAAVAPVAPPAVPADCIPARPVPVLHIHGTADPCAPYDGGPGGGCLAGNTNTFTGMSARQMVDFWINNNGGASAATTVYRNGAATCLGYGQGGGEVVFCTIEGGGHAWPDGTQYLPVERIGPVTHDISFARIWEFFNRHRLP